MHASLAFATCGLATLLAWPAGVAAQEVGSGDHLSPKTDEELITNAMSAAPEAVAGDATIIALDEKGHARTLREGANNFTCLPDNPASPGNDPMCLDANGMEWANAWLSKKTPPAGKVGFAYMLQGGSDASNADPHASEPAEGATWITTGPHVMIFNAGEMAQGYPIEKENPDTQQPYVMWPGTPYEHLMIPVK